MSEPQPHMIYWSLIAGLAGVVVARYGLFRLARGDSERAADLFWLLGLAGPLPAWLIAFVGLLGRLDGRRPEMSVAAWWLFSAAAALGGVIFTHGRIRAFEDSGQPLAPAMSWRIGVGTLLPAWGLALLGAVLTSLDR